MKQRAFNGRTDGRALESRRRLGGGGYFTLKTRVKRNYARARAKCVRPAATAITSRRAIRVRRFSRIFATDDRRTIINERTTATDDVRYVFRYGVPSGARRRVKSARDNVRWECAALSNSRQHVDRHTHTHTHTHLRVFVYILCNKTHTRMYYTCIIFVFVSVRVHDRDNK